ncbi:unnamed protein product [Taenia asiatica]|uniref:NPH3 domain-containing protein n=1 Tax=Taenia asiatica TaxID=60517 RepID=A0A0R3VYD2_TAEAS|nr:unnamed protein product [Taenia asiatica]
MATDIALPGAVDWVMMKLCFGHCAMLVLEKQERVSFDQLFFALVPLIKTNKQADSLCTTRSSGSYTAQSVRNCMEAATAASDYLISDSKRARGGGRGVGHGGGGTGTSGTGSAPLPGLQYNALLPVGAMCSVRWFESLHPVSSGLSA